MVTALSRVMVEPVQVEVRAPGRNALSNPRGLAEMVSVPSAIPGVKVCTWDQVCGRWRLT